MTLLRSIASLHAAAHQCCCALQYFIFQKWILKGHEIGCLPFFPCVCLTLSSLWAFRFVAPLTRSVRKCSRKCLSHASLQLQRRPQFCKHIVRGWWYNFWSRAPLSAEPYFPHQSVDRKKRVLLWQRVCKSTLSTTLSLHNILHVSCHYQHWKWPLRKSHKALNHHIHHVPFLQLRGMERSYTAQRSAVWKSDHCWIFWESI